MRILPACLCLSIVPLFVSCGQQEAAPNIDPTLGRACFQSKLPSLPPGSQYEGITGVAGDQLSIGVMNGVEVVTVKCTLTPGGTLQVPPK